MSYEQEGYVDQDQEINWDAVGVPIPVGRFDFELVKWEFKPTSEGKPMVNVQATVKAVHNADHEENIGRSVFENFVFTQAGGFRVKQFAKAIGFELPRVINKEVLDQLGESMLGQQFTADITHRVWQGEPRGQISKYYPLGGPTDQVPEADEQQQQSKPATKASANGTNGHAKTNGTAAAAGKKPATKATKGQQQARR